jgi:hypothetical protein
VLIARSDEAASKPLEEVDDKWLHPADGLQSQLYTGTAYGPIKSKGAPYRLHFFGVKWSMHRADGPHRMDNRKSLAYHRSLILLRFLNMALATGKSNLPSSKAGMDRDHIFLRQCYAHEVGF